MSDESPTKPTPESDTPPAGRGRSPGSVAALREHAAKKGEVRNPQGLNGRKRQDLIALFLEEPSETDASKSKLRRVIEKLYAKALAGSDMAAKTLIEQYAGRPKQAVDLSNEAGDLGIPTVRIHFAKPFGDDLSEDGEAAKTDEH
jgi:hypothetical protein